MVIWTRDTIMYLAIIGGFSLSLLIFEIYITSRRRSNK